jgi:hypothetical protein
LAFAFSWSRKIRVLELTKEESFGGSLIMLRRPNALPKSCTKKKSTIEGLGKTKASNTHLPKQIQPARNKLGQTTPLASTCRNRGISALALSPLSALSMAILEPAGLFRVHGRDRVHQNTLRQVHRVFGRRRERRVIQRGAECAVIPVSDGFGRDEAAVVFADLALDENVL